MLIKKTNTNGRSFTIVLSTLVFFAALTCAASGQTTWYVDDDAPGDPKPGNPTVSDPLEDGSAEHPFDGIQEGIDMSANGDTVLVLDGTYTGDGNRDIDFAGRLITLRSENGPETCIIDCQGSEFEQHRGLWFHSNETAGAMFKGFTITGGFTLGPGGGIYVFDGCHPTIVDCRFVSNSAGRGGGMHVDLDSNPVVNRCEFISNHASDDGGGMYIINGSNPTIIECQFIGNTAVDDGGGMYNWFFSSPVVLNSVFVGNHAGEGGAIYNNQRGSPVLVNCVISGNSATFAGAMQTDEGFPTLTNCTITANTASTSAGGFRNFSSITTLQLTNCIVWDNGGEQILDIDGSTTSVKFTDIAGGWSGDGNIDADPLFVDPLGPDGLAGTADDDLRLMPGSPCIDAADYDAYITANGGLTDLDGNDRVIDDTSVVDTGIGFVTYLDMGAYEVGLCQDGGMYSMDVLTSLEVCIRGPGDGLNLGCVCMDLNDDEHVDLRDFAQFQLNFAP